MGILIPLVLIFFTCLLIWRACDSFEIASEYIGRNLSEGVRGGTINAISSSVPELFTTLIALFVLSDRDGFSVGIGTTAGSALFNGMIIPAACILSVVGAVVLGIRVTSVNVSTKVLLRDGLSLIFCEIILILLINGARLHWWQGLILMGLYGTYLAFMLLSMKRATGSEDAAVDEDEQDFEGEAAAERSVLGHTFYWLSLGPLMDMERVFVREKHRQQIDEETWNGWPLLLASTAVIGAACWLLVKACEWLGTGSVEHPSYSLFGYELQGIGMPAMFVAVIFASMATSVPDLVMSIRDARDGDYDDAVANALGSNVFDICFALGFPLFLFTLLHGPIEMSPDVVAQSGELRLLLLVLTIVGFFVYYVGKRGVSETGIQYVEMRSGKAFILLGIYILFVGYIVARSQEMTLALELSASLQSLLHWLPTIG
ncbi:sodium/potassium/calcium exchanger 5 [Rhodopirellula maiorica SM1]|uniref:Sodium/potassium/calcium exchanger 5 n=1 Tax=Rhodopirellula maiorica SM1 TaxID=1265738 RepID=M5RUI9_9BACT|nr:sodium/potassium/calcium exchanger 5 [Rhodopirellula maiorica]EMI23008.1 sodium/potassium/calcium exchanger 5 [Rhodopirellula maiorica SM1]